MRVIVESPLKADTPEDFQRNFRFLLWCCRAEFEAGNEPIASHLVCPWFMDDQVPAERDAGINSPWVWDDNGDPHVFYDDIGISSGMRLARHKCEMAGIVAHHRSLEDFRPDMWAAFQRGEWPIHTPGFEIGDPLDPMFGTRVNVDDWRHPLLSLLGIVPEDCRELLTTIMPNLVRVMQGGGVAYPAFNWRDNASYLEHLNHADKHDIRATIKAVEMVPRDKSDGQPERAHQIVRLMMALFLELKAEKETR